MGRPKILVVDDAFFMRKMLGDIIKDGGYEVYFGEDGLQAVEKVKELTPDIVTLDISMPGMDGLEALGRIRETSPGTKVIMVSAVTGDTVIQQAMNDGAANFIKKPFNKEEILEMLKMYL